MPVDAFARTLAGSAGAMASLAQTASGRRAYFAEDGATSPWYLSTAPNAIYLPEANKTAIAYETLSAAAQKRAYNVLAYNHTTGAVEGPYLTAVDAVTFDDDHGVPSLVRDHQGYVHIFGGGHFGASLFSASSNSPDDVTAWTARNTWTGKYCYPHPFGFGQQIGITFRKDASATPGSGMQLVWFKTTALASGVPTWGSEQVLLDLQSDTRAYAFSVIERAGEIWILVVRANDANTYEQDVFLFILNPVTGYVQNLSRGSNVAPASQPIQRAFAEGSFRIVDQSTGGTYGGHAAACFDVAGNYHVLWMDTPTISSSATSLNIMHKYWNGSTWSAPVVVDTIGSYKAGISLVPQRNGSIRFMWGEKTNGFNRAGSISQRVYSGGSWGSKTTVASPGAFQLDLPVPVKNGRSDLDAVFCECVTVADADTNGGRDAQGGGLRLYGFGSNGIVTPKFTFRPQTSQFIDRLPTAPTDAVIRRYDALIGRLVDAGIWADIDGLYFLAAADQASALINLKADRFNLLPRGTLTFTANRGFTGDGATGYLDTQFNPSLGNGGCRFQQNSAHLSAWVLSEGQNNIAEIGVPIAAGYQTLDLTLIARNTSDQLQGRINAGGTTTAGSTTTTSLGHTLVRRTGASTTDIYKNGARFGQDTTTASNGLVNANITLLRSHTSYSNRQVAFASFGGGIADTSTSRAKPAIFTNALYRALFEIGATAQL